MRGRFGPRGLVAAGLLSILTVPPALAQDRPDEDSLFGAPEPATGSQPAQDRPDEASLFGAPEPATGNPPAGTTPSTGTVPGGEAPATSAPGFAAPDENALFGQGAQATQLSSEAAPEDPLRIGGQLYSRLLANVQEGIPLERTKLSAPQLIDLYFDARPNDRLRGMVIGRISYNPAAAVTSADDPDAASSSFSGLTGSSTGRSPSFVLNQAWLRFDIARTVFVTAGKQHLKWGTARFWSPTDYLQPFRRDPLEPFDVRTGVNMVKLHVPWEARGWNFYAIGLLDSVSPAGRRIDYSTGEITLDEDPQKTLHQLGAAFRGEVVFSTIELGLDTVLQRRVVGDGLGLEGLKPKFGIDLSAGVGPFDLYAEAALRDGIERTLWQQEEGATEAYIPEEAPDPGWNVAVSGGINWQHMYNDDDVLTVGLEYFYNPLGYDDPLIYPWLFISGDYQPFYTGKHYAAVYALLSAPGSWEDTSFTLSGLGNLSDQSYTVRLDWSMLALTHLRVEAYGAYHFGTLGGEFRLGTEEELTLEGRPLGAAIPAPLIDVGISLRINI